MGLAPIMAGHLEREERKCYIFFVWSKIKGTKHKAPTSMGQFAQCFKYIGTFIPRYTIIKQHFLTFGKRICQNFIGSKFMCKLPKYASI